MSTLTRRTEKELERGMKRPISLEEKRDFREKKYNINKAYPVFRLMSTLTRRTEKELERGMKRPISLEEKRENFIAAVRK